MKPATIISRVLLGLIFVTFGLNMFLNFIHMPPPPEGPAREFMTALFMSHYVYVVGALQVVGGLILLGSAAGLLFTQSARIEHWTAKRNELIRLSGPFRKYV